MQSRAKNGEHETLLYSVAKTKTRLVDCGLLNNGGLSTKEEVAEGEYILTVHCATFYFERIPLLLEKLQQHMYVHAPKFLAKRNSFESSLLCCPSAMNQWASLCKALPGTTAGLSPWTKCDIDFETVKEKPERLPHVRVVNPVLWEEVVPVDAQTAPPLFALALGCGGRREVERIYQDMMEFARYKGQCIHLLSG